MVDYTRYRSDNNEGPANQDRPPPRRGASRLWAGCCGGCAGVALFFAVILAIMLYLLFRSHPVMPPQAFFLPDADGFAVLQIRPEDEAVAALLHSLAEERLAIEDTSAERRRHVHRFAENLPDNIDAMAPLNFVCIFYQLDQPEQIQAPDPVITEKDDEVSRILKQLIAMRAEKRRFDKALAVSMRRRGFAWVFTRTFMNAIRQRGGKITRYRRAEIGEIPDRAALGRLKNNIMLSNRTEIVRSWIDAISEGPPDDPTVYRGPARLESIHDRLDTSSVFYFAVSNHDDELKSMIVSLFEMFDVEISGSGGDGAARNGIPPAFADSVDAAASGIYALGGSLRIVTPERGELDIYAECMSRDAAETAAGELAMIMRELVEENVITVDASYDDTVAHLRMIFHDLPGILHGGD